MAYTEPTGYRLAIVGIEFTEDTAAAARDTLSGEWYTGRTDACEVDCVAVVSVAEAYAIASGL